MKQNLQLPVSMENSAHLLVETRVKWRIYMWKSRVEIEDYSVAYVDHIATFKAPYC